jgi:IPT/TIG domain
MSVPTSALQAASNLSIIDSTALRARAVVSRSKHSKLACLIAFSFRRTVILAECLAALAGLVAITAPEQAFADGTNTTSVTDIANPDGYTCNQSGFVGFESLPDGTTLPGTIAGLDFVTTGGHTWLVGDFAAGHYNGKYPNGAYMSEGTHWAWLGEQQGSGRIDFANGAASYFSLLTSVGSSGVYLEAFDANGNALATAGPAPYDIQTGHMTELKITRASRDMAYVIVHDTGNFFLVDSLCTDAPGVTENGNPTVSAVAPDGGPWTGGTNLTVQGTHFAGGDELCFDSGTPPYFSGPVACASQTTVVSSTKITAIAPALPSLDSPYVGQLFVTIQRCCSGTSLVDYPSNVSFTYYVPEIGVLVFQNAVGRHEECTGSVVDSANHSVILTAGHCVGGSGHYWSDFAFAPGYYGPLCSESQTGQHSANAFNCGKRPYGVWTSYAVRADSHWLEHGASAVDFGFVDMRPQSGASVGAKVGGGLAITWEPGNDQTWSLMGDPGGNLRSCTAQSSHFVAANSVNYPELPEVFSVSDPACEVISGGASGGPWLNADNGQTYGLGAVNSTSSCPGGPGSSGCMPGVTGTYMGRQAHDAWRALQKRPAP